MNRRAICVSVVVFTTAICVVLATLVSPLFGVVVFLVIVPCELMFMMPIDGEESDPNDFFPGGCTIIIAKLEPRKISYTVNGIFLMAIPLWPGFFVVFSFVGLVSHLALTQYLRSEAKQLENRKP